MAITNGYTTLAEIKTYLAITQATYEADLERAIEAASRQIDSWCGRRFWVDSAATAYYYTAEDYVHLPVLDISTTTGLIVAADHNADGTHENTFTADSFNAAYGYRLLPRNIQAAEPGTALKAIAGGWPVGVDGGVKVTAKVGWTTVPTPVAQACLTQAGRLFKRKDAPFGVLGVADQAGRDVTSTLPRLDPDLRPLVDGYRRFDPPVEGV